VPHEVLLPYPQRLEVVLAIDNLVETVGVELDDTGGSA
jgi:hypothetical protein